VSEIAVHNDRDFSRRRLTDLLDRHAWDTAAAAEELAVTRKTIYARLQRLGNAIPNRYRRRTTPETGGASLMEAKIHQIHRACGESGESPR